MADFEVVVPAAVIAVWEDPPYTDPITDLSYPTRLNTPGGLPHRHMTAPLGWLQVRAVVGGVEGPADASLGGRLFLCSVAEYPTAGLPPVTQDAGFSSRCRVLLSEVGHYTIVLRREGGGAVILHVDAVP